jgi:hypothetical protein
MSPLTEALDLRQILFEDAQKPGLSPADRSKLTRAWCEVNDRIQELRGHGKPRPVTARNDPDARAKGKPRVWAAEPVRIEPEPAPAREVG